MSDQSVDTLLMKPLQAVHATAKDLRTQVERALSGAAEKALAEIEQQRIDLDGRIRAWESLAARVEQRLAEADDARRRGEERISELQRELAEAKKSESELAVAQIELERQVAASREEAAGVGRRLAEVQRDATGAREEAEEAGQRLQEANRRLGEAQEEVSRARGRAEEEKRERVAAEAKLGDVLQDLSGVCDLLAGLRSKYGPGLGEKPTDRTRDSGPAGAAHELVGDIPTPELPESEPVANRGAESKRSAPPTWNSAFELVPVRAAARSPLGVSVAEQIGTYWVPRVSPLELLGTCLDWVIYRGPGRRRPEAHPEWTGEQLTAGGDFASDLGSVRVRRSADGRRWAVHFTHEDSRAASARWHQAFEAFEDGDGTLVRHLGGLEPGRREPLKVSPTPPRFVQSLFVRGGTLRAGSNYAADAEHVLGADDVPTWAATEMLAPNRHYALVLAGAQSTVPADCWRPAASGQGLLLPSALAFRLADAAAAKAVVKAVKNSMEVGSRFLGHDLDSAVWFLGSRRVLARWDAGQGRAIVSHQDLCARVTRLLLRTDDRWPAVIKEFDR